MSSYMELFGPGLRSSPPSPGPSPPSPPASATLVAMASARSARTLGQPEGQYFLNPATVTPELKTCAPSPLKLFSQVPSTTLSPKIDFPKSNSLKKVGPCGFRVFFMLGSFSLSNWWFGPGSFSLGHLVSVSWVPMPGSSSLGVLDFLLRQQR